MMMSFIVSISKICCFDNNITFSLIQRKKIHYNEIIKLTIKLTNSTKTLLYTTFGATFITTTTTTTDATATTNTNNNYANLQGKLSTPHANECELFIVDRDVLFSCDGVCEVFLRALIGIFVASHYKVCCLLLGGGYK